MKCFKVKRNSQISINIDFEMNSFKFDNFGIFSQKSFESIALDLFILVVKWQKFPFFLTP